jgi:hypothetical protein
MGMCAPYCAELRISGHAAVQEHRYQQCPGRSLPAQNRATERWIAGQNAELLLAGGMLDAVNRVILCGPLAFSREQAGKGERKNRVLDSPSKLGPQQNRVVVGWLSMKSEPD